MANVYIIHEDGSTAAMSRIHCQDEERELQLTLEKNPDLLPGDQIDPEDPRRWLLVKHEMPVPDPNTGSDRWSVDFFFVDQDAIPTFVECKRFTDTRSRREVVGQMLEYAANGHYYWTRETIRNFAEAAAKQKGITLEEALRLLHPANDESADDFFERVQQNLREGQLRIIFFLEESPVELRSIVDFLNKQMERSEVLLVEARQFSLNGTQVVVPTLFGYSEEAVRVKRSVTVTTATPRRKWDKVSFFADARAKLKDTEVQAVETLYNQCLSLGCEISWGSGANRGSFNVKELSICPRSLLTVSSNGNLALNFGWLDGSETALRTRERLKDLVVQSLGLPIPDDYGRKWPVYPTSEWGGKVGSLFEVLKQLVAEFRGAAV